MGLVVGTTFLVAEYVGGPNGHQRWGRQATKVWFLHLGHAQGQTPLADHVVATNPDHWAHNEFS